MTAHGGPLFLLSPGPQASFAVLDTFDALPIGRGAMKHAALLDWEDVQVLVRLCSVSIPQDRVETRAFEAARRELVDSVLVYLQEWLPGQLIDDEARVPLIQALTAYAQACHALEKSGGEMPRGSIPAQGAIDQCTRLCMLLVRAMEGEGPDAL